MQLLVIEKNVAKDAYLDAENLLFPVLIVDERDSSIKLAQENGEVTMVSSGGVSQNLVVFAHAKRFGVVSPEVVEYDVAAIDINLSAHELEKYGSINNPIKYKNT